MKSDSKLEGFSSPVVSYNLNLTSPDKNIQMVESQIQKREYIPETPGSIVKDTMTSADKSKISGSDFRAYRSPSET